MDANIRGRDGDAANKEKIRTTATEKEGARATRRTAVSHGGAGVKTTTTEAAVEATAVASRVDTGASTTATTATMVTAMTMTAAQLWRAAGRCVCNATATTMRRRRPVAAAAARQRWQRRRWWQCNSAAVVVAAVAAWRRSGVSLAAEQRWQPG